MMVEGKESLKIIVDPRLDREQGAGSGERA